MTKKEKINTLSEVMDRLEKLYPVSECALDYKGDGWRLLVMGRLSAQCTDARVNVVSRELFSSFPTPEDMAGANIEDIERIIKPCGLYRMKAENIKMASEMLVREYGGVLPDSMDELLKLPGVGRKIANLLLGDIYAKDAVVCDTHCMRICARLGMYPEKLRDPYKIEMILRSLMDVSRGSDFCHRIVSFGREICTARSPKCTECPLSDICKYRSKNKV